MIRTLGAAVIAVLVASTASAQNERGFVRGLGGVTFGSTVTSSIIGGGAGFNITDTIQVTGEFGRMQNVLPTEIEDVFETLSVLLTLDLGVPASIGVDLPVVYGTAGLRLNVPTSGRIRPFIDAGVGVGSVSAKFDVEVEGVDQGELEDIEREASGEVDGETEFLFSLGGGIAVPLSDALGLDVGYRYHRIAAEEGINSNAFYAALRFIFR